VSLRNVVRVSSSALGLILLAAASRPAAPGQGRPAFRFDRRTIPGVRNVSGDADQFPILEQNGQGVCAIDFDGDGRLDLYLPNGSTRRRWESGAAGQSALLRNQGHRSFEDVTASAGVPGPRWANGCAVADYDGDGRPDLFVTGWKGSVLYRNRGDGTFEDATRAAGLAVPGWASSAVFADLDGDGLLDLAVSRYVEFDWKTYPRTDDDGRHGRPCRYKGVASGCPPGFHLPESTLIFRQEAPGRFQDVSEESGAAAIPTRGLGIVAIPTTGRPGRPDLYLACDQEENRLFRNASEPGRIRFVEAGRESGSSVNAAGRWEASMGIAIGDANEDGRPDLLVTNFADETNTLYLGGEGVFEDATASSGLGLHPGELAWGTALADFDADSHLDAVVANGHIYPQIDRLGIPDETYAEPLRLFAGSGTGRFREVGLPQLSRRRSRRGLLVADLDNDGRLDFVTQAHRGAPEIFWNEGTAGNRWIRFRLEGARPRDPGGARVEILLPDGSRRVGWVNPQQSYQSSGDPRVYFGLGRQARVVSARVLWPDGAVQEIPGPLAADRQYFLRAGTAHLAEEPTARARLP
jgi:hypothetical protein